MVVSSIASNPISLIHGQNVITIKVTESGKEAKTYIITVTRATPLEKVDKPTLSSAGVATWTDVANAAGYFVFLYKDGTKIIQKDVSSGATGYDFLSDMRAAGVGAYTVAVAAKSSGVAYENGPISDASDPQTIAKLAKVTAGLTWSLDNACWTTVLNAASYDVQLYKDGVAQGTAKNVLAADALAGVDFTADIATAGAGVYTYTVTAKSSGADLFLDADESEQSNINDKKAPVFAEAHPKAGAVQPDGSKQVELLLKVNEAGTAYYVVVPDGAAIPSPAQVMAGQDGTNNPALASGNAPISANTEKSIVTTALPANATSYDAYVIAKDSANNATVAVKVDITTPPPVKTVTVGELEGGEIKAKTAATGRYYTVTTANITDGKTATVTWYLNGAKDSNGNTPPAGITIAPAGTVMSNEVTLNVTVNESASTVTGYYYFTVTIDGVESAVKVLTVGNVATFTGATLDIFNYQPNNCLIINGLSNIEGYYFFDIGKLTYSDGIDSYTLVGTYVIAADPSGSVKGTYYYNNTDTLIITLTDADFDGISLLTNFTSGSDSLSAASGWNSCNGVFADPVNPGVSVTIIYE